jgi:hypothetical protein
MTTVIIPFRRFCILLLAVSLIGGSAMAAGSRYLSGTPDIRAAVDGWNEFTPGEEVDLLLVLENQGSDAVKILQGGSGGESSPSTALMVSAELRAGDTPLVVRADPQMVGTLQAGEAVRVPFRIKVMNNATGGEYLVPLDLHYTRITSEEVIGSESVIFRYAEESETLPVPVRVKDVISLDVPEVQAFDLAAGSEGYLVLSIQNTGSLAGKKAIARIFRGNQSPVLPVTGSVYLGDFPPGTIQESRFRVMVDETADEKTYPMVVAVEYEGPSGERLFSRNVTIGVPVAGKTEFSVSDGNYTMYRGTRRTIEVTYENSGAVPVYSAQARIRTDEPFTSRNDRSSLGDLAPGEQAVARLEIGVDKSATVKKYGLDTEIRYRDALNQSRISDPIRITIEVQDRPVIQRILYNPVLMSIIIAIVLGSVYYLKFHRNNRPRKPDEGTG